MSNIKNIRDKESLKSGEYSKEIRAKLQSLKIKLPKSLEGLPTDLGDIKEICNNYIYSIDALLAFEQKNEELIEVLKSIQEDLYIHLPFHIKELKKPLIKLIDELEENKKQ